MKKLILNTLIILGLSVALFSCSHKEVVTPEPPIYQQEFTVEYSIDSVRYTIGSDTNHPITINEVLSTKTGEYKTTADYGIFRENYLNTEIPTVTNQNSYGDYTTIGKIYTLKLPVKYKQFIQNTEVTTISIKYTGLLYFPYLVHVGAGTGEDTRVGNSIGNRVLSINYVLGGEVSRSSINNPGQKLGLIYTEGLNITFQGSEVTTNKILPVFLKVIFE